MGSMTGIENKHIYPSEHVSWWWHVSDSTRARPLNSLADILYCTAVDSLTVSNPDVEYIPRTTIDAHASCAQLQAEEKL